MSSVAGRISEFYPFWRSLTSDTFVLNAVKGYKIEFIDNNIPIQRFIPFPIKMSSSEALVVDDTVQQLLNKGVIRMTTHESGEFISTIFVRNKKESGKFRMILNLKPLNQFVEYHKFKMDTLRSVLKLIKKDCFLAFIDIQDAYYTVKIDPYYQKLLKFQ